MGNVSFQSVNIEDGFWKEQQKVNRETTVWAIYDRFKESGRFDALRCGWQEGMPNKPHIFWDSDVAKWLEGASYLMQKQPDARLEAIADNIADTVEAHQREDGYFNSYFLTMSPDEIFTHRMDHELYCAGHFVEAAIAYYHATGKRKLLDCMERYIALIDRVFRIEHSAAFDTPGHEEIEMALAKLYEETKNENYLKLLRFFVDHRGRSKKDSSAPFSEYHTQSHLPAVEQHTAEGHAVRALYWCCGIQDLAALEDDADLKETCLAIFDDIVTKKMYITGGVGSTYAGEAFTFPYDLPDDRAYSETCAGIALAMFCRRLWSMYKDGKYADIAEQAIYNTVLSGISLSGDEFFYENPLAVDVRQRKFYEKRPSFEQLRWPIIRRVKLFECSCCPPNLMRLIGAIGDYAYSVEGDTIYTHLYMDNTADIPVAGKTFRITQKTKYPLAGHICLTVGTEGSCKLALRIPAWCQNPEVKVNGEKIHGEICNGYFMIEKMWAEGDCIELTLPMIVRVVEAAPECRDYCGKIAVCRGPMVYCVESEDCDGQTVVRDVRIHTDAPFTMKEEMICGRELPVIYAEGEVRRGSGNLYQNVPFERMPVSVRMIPYFTWANRGEDDMSVWLLG